MGIQKLISISVTLAFVAVFFGKLPWVLKEVRIAQMKLVKESQASNWGRAWIPSR